jgi:hypothetical protein
LNTSAAQKKLIHGIDFAYDPEQAHEPEGSLAGGGFWRKQPNDRSVYLKPDKNPTDFTRRQREVAFHNLARDVFGLGDMVPTTAIVRHPQTGQELAAIDQVDGRHYGSHASDLEALHGLGAKGDLDKAGLTDWVLGMYDRHPGNWMLGKEGGLKLIDHGDAFDDDPAFNVEPPDYLETHWRHLDPNVSGTARMPQVHPAAQDWAAKVNPQELAKHMRKNGVPERYVKAAVARATFLRLSAEQSIHEARPMRHSEIFEGKVE